MLQTPECPRCGAPAPTAGAAVTVCQYCGTELHDTAARSASAATAAAPVAAPAPPPTASVALGEDAVLGLCKQHLTGADNVFLHPAIPPKKEGNAREMHATHLPREERVLALFDNTLFGAGDDGFVLTARRVCWRNVLFDPLTLEWQDIAPGQVTGSGQQLSVMGHEIQISMDQTLGTRCHELFRALAKAARGGRE